MKSFDRPRTGNLRVAKRLTLRTVTIKGSDRQSVGGFVRYEKGVLRIRSELRCRSRAGRRVQTIRSSRNGPPDKGRSPRPPHAAPRNAPVSGGLDPSGASAAEIVEVPKMAKTGMIRARVEPELKSQAEEVFSRLGLSPTAAITLFYRQVTLHNGLPFAVKVPNAETIAALRQARTGEGLTEYTSLEDLKARHG